MSCLTEVAYRITKKVRIVSKCKKITKVSEYQQLKNKMKAQKLKIYDNCIKSSNDKMVVLLLV
jgi:hypothetical protein